MSLIVKSIIIFCILYLVTVIKNIIELVIKLNNTKPPIQTLETKIFNPAIDYGSNINFKDIKILPTNKSTFETKIFKG